MSESSVDMDLAQSPLLRKLKELDNQRAEAKLVSRFPGAELHHHPKHPAQAYLTQSIEGTSNEGWKEFIETSQRDIGGIVRTDNKLVWTEYDMNNGVDHAFLMSAEADGEHGVTKLVVFPKAMSKNGSILVYYDNPSRGPSARAAVEYLKRSLGDKAHEVNLTFEGYESVNVPITPYNGPLSDFNGPQK